MHVALISHDHYDHLDLPIIKSLASRGARCIVPLGVGAHLEAWAVRATMITELDWWESAAVDSLTITATPARHFSGRGLGDSGRTLWAGCAVAGPRHRAFYSGDTAMVEWWPEVPWRTVSEAPVWSTRVSYLLANVPNGVR